MEEAKKRASPGLSLLMGPGPSGSSLLVRFVWNVLVLDDSAEKGELERSRGVFPYRKRIADVAVMARQVGSPSS